MRRNHLNFMGHQIIAGQSCDTIVRADQRGKKWFIRLAQKNYEFASENDVTAVFGFPNRNSYPGFVKYLDWVRLFNLTHYRYRFGFKKVVGSKIDSFIKYFVELKHRLKYLLFSKVSIKEFNIDKELFEAIEQDCIDLEEGLYDQIDWYGSWDR